MSRPTPEELLLHPFLVPKAEIPQTLTSDSKTLTEQSKTILKTSKTQQSSEAVEENERMEEEEGGDEQFGRMIEESESYDDAGSRRSENFDRIKSYEDENDELITDEIVISGLRLEESVSSISNIRQNDYSQITEKSKSMRNYLSINVGAKKLKEKEDEQTQVPLDKGLSKLGDSSMKRDDVLSLADFSIKGFFT